MNLIKNNPWLLEPLRGARIPQGYKTFSRPLRGKKGGEKILSIWWFFVLAVVTIGISFGVILFYGSPYDIRIKEAETLNERLSICLIKDNGFLNEKVLQENFDVLGECGLKEKVFGEGSKFFFKLDFYKESLNNFIDPILEGDYSMEDNCGISGSIKAEGYPKCFNTKNVFLYSEGGLVKQGSIQILTASNNRGEGFK